MQNQSVQQANISIMSSFSGSKKGLCRRFFARYTSADAGNQPECDYGGHSGKRRMRRSVFMIRAGRIQTRMYRLIFMKGWGRSAQSGLPGAEM